MAKEQPKTKPGVTGFVQEYNQEGPKTSDLNPDVVTEDSVLPKPRGTAATATPAKTRKVGKHRK
jgi:hypothetical protein